ncbi:DUF6042 family protein [Streptomyces bobili]|uniref:DUF6042 family protein n=1 Tax=Streptomyces bobili TaxID=67280 RepID=UPI0036F95509
MSDNPSVPGPRRDTAMHGDWWAWDYEEKPEGREASEAKCRERFGAMLTAAGFPVPRTVRDLSQLYLTWGLAHREETPDGTRWSMPATATGRDADEVLIALTELVGSD